MSAANIIVIAPMVVIPNNLLQYLGSGFCFITGFINIEH